MTCLDTRIVLNGNTADMCYVPKPLAVLRTALDAAQNDLPANSLSGGSLLGNLATFPCMLNLSEKWNTANYRNFLHENRPWNMFHAGFKSNEVSQRTVKFLYCNSVELTLQGALRSASYHLWRAVRILKRVYLAARGLRLPKRFEFSSLRAGDEQVRSQTGAARKAVTLVLTMMKEGEWQTTCGGGPGVNTTRDVRYAFNWQNNIVPWDKIEIADTSPLVPSQRTAFVRIRNSLRSVREITENRSHALRKSCTTVIEREI